MASTSHSAPPPSPPLSSLRVLSLNCWGLKFLSKHRAARLSEIGRQIALSTPAPDIVGLQECWTQADFESIHAQTAHQLPHAKFYYSGVFGGGLAILSRFPITESSMTRYVLNGRPTAFFRGDWFVGKGVASARVALPGGQALEVFNTHLHAPYESEPNDSYLCHRTAQAWDIAKMMRGAYERGALVLGLGDFNMLPLSLAHRIVEGHAAPLRDVWRVVHPGSSVGRAGDEAERSRRREAGLGEEMPSVRENVRVNGATCDSAANTWRWSKERQKELNKGRGAAEVEWEEPDPRGKRLDYIFFGDGTRVRAAAGSRRGSEGSGWEVESVNVGMMQRHPTLHCSLSDHFSVETTITNRAALSTSSQSTLDEPTLSQDRLLPPLYYQQILAIISQYKTREERQRSLRLWHFYISIVVSIGCLVAMWWSPRNFVAFILCLVSTLNLAAGVLDGLIGGLFVSSELRAMREFEWEVRSCLDRSQKHNADGKAVKEADVNAVLEEPNLTKPDDENECLQESCAEKGLRPGAERG